MKPRLTVFIALATLAFPAPAFAWGKTGHRTIGAIADTHLSGIARAQIQQLIGVETLDDASTWPDDMKSNPDPFWQKTASPWHYVTVGGLTYDRAPPEGDALEALKFFAKLIRDPRSSVDQRQLALRFIVHIVGDLHQPLHNGRPGDRGGNEVKVKWFGRDTNLHAVWDSALVDEIDLSFTELAARLRRHTTSADVVKYWEPNPRVWIAESVQVRETVYPAKTDLSYDYVYQHTPMVELRLKQAGVRLAAYLNELFATPIPDSRR